LDVPIGVPSISIDNVGALIGALGADVPPVMRIKRNTPATPPKTAPMPSIAIPNTTNFQPLFRECTLEGYREYPTLISSVFGFPVI
jgi:hypothetical protein